MRSADELSLELPDLRLAARAWGPADGRPVLAMHGWLDNAATFERLAPLLIPEGERGSALRIVSLDLPGHGLSEHKRGPYHFVDWVADALAAADALGWRRFSLLGHSMGAGIASLVAGTMPERIDRCALIEGLGPMVDEPERAAERLARALRVEARKRRSASKRVFTTKEEAAQRLVEAAKMELDSGRVLVERGLVAVEGGYVWRADPRLRVDSRLRLSEVAVRAFLRAITCPVLLVRAEQGWPVDPELHAGRREAVAELELVELEGHHHLHLDDPAAVAAHVGPFLRGGSEGDHG